MLTSLVGDSYAHGIIQKFMGGGEPQPGKPNKKLHQWYDEQGRPTGNNHGVAMPSVPDFGFTPEQKAKMAAQAREAVKDIAGTVTLAANREPSAPAPVQSQPNTGIENTGIVQS